MTTAQFPSLLGVIACSPTDASKRDALFEVFKEHLTPSQSPPVILLGPPGACASLGTILEEPGVEPGSLAVIKVAGEIEPEKAMELVHACDHVVLIRNGAPEQSKKLRDCALESGCASVAVLHPGAARAELLRSPEPVQKAGWLPDLFSHLKLDPHATIEDIQVTADPLANRTAPSTRRWWRTVMFLQGLAVTLPFAWFLAEPFGYDASVAPLAGAAGVMLFTFLAWWTRWRGMQSARARSRLLSEAARSMSSTRSIPGGASLAGVETVPALRPLLWHAAKASESAKGEAWDRTPVSERADEGGILRCKPFSAEHLFDRFLRWGASRSAYRTWMDSSVSTARHSAESSPKMQVSESSAKLPNPR
jgi:hypothetical protein